MFGVGGFLKVRAGGGVGLIVVWEVEGVWVPAEMARGF